MIHFWDGNIPGIKSKDELAKPEYVIQFGIPPNRIDLIADIDGVEFEKAWKDKKTELLQIHNQQIPVYFISLEHLIKNKERSGRPKDLEDLKYLRRADS